MSFSFDYQIIRDKWTRSSTTISIKSNGLVVVRAPKWLPEIAIEEFLRERSFWIEQNLRRIQSLPKVDKKKYIDGESHLYFGSEYPLKVTRLPFINKARLKFESDIFQAVVPDHFSLTVQKKEVKKLMVQWYLDHGKIVINEKVYRFTRELNVNYNRITLKQVSSIWGSCSHKSNLNFNRKLVMAPHEVVDYVVIHEVCHLVHHNHGPHFWALVRSLDPNYRAHMRWLKENHSLLYI